MSEQLCYSATNEPAGVNRRREHRYSTESVAASVLLTFEDASTCIGRAMDVSRSGLRVRTKSSPRSGSLIEVRWPTLSVVGRIRYWRQVGLLEYDLGVEITEMTCGRLLAGFKHIAEVRLALYVAEALPAVAMEEVRNHLKLCPLCRQILAKILLRAASDLEVLSVRSPAIPRLPPADVGVWPCSSLEERGA